MYNNLIMVNKAKMRYCYEIHDQLMEKDLTTLSTEFQKAKISNISILELKKTLYCSICDANQQKLFHNGAHLIVYD